MLGNPDFLILDEPANGLDPIGMRELRELIITLNQTYGKTILISSHLLDEIQKICSQVIIIREGELVWAGKLSDNQEDNLEEMFIQLVTK